VKIRFPCRHILERDEGDVQRAGRKTRVDEQPIYRNGLFFQAALSLNLRDDLSGQRRGTHSESLCRRRFGLKVLY
jgi:hypothetical protein